MIQWKHTQFGYLHYATIDDWLRLSVSEPIRSKGDTFDPAKRLRVSINRALIGYAPDPESGKALAISRAKAMLSAALAELEDKP